MARLTDFHRQHILTGQPGSRGEHGTEVRGGWSYVVRRGTTGRDLAGVGEGRGGCGV
jgi:hypothetical protein